MPQSVALNIYRGDSFDWKFTFWANTQKTIPYDLTGAVAEAQIRLKPNDTVLAALDCTITQPNTIDVALTHEICEYLPVGAAVWDLQVTYPTGGVKTLVAGAVKVTADVTCDYP
jgi:hypothetical protein